jgi:lysophospholipase L1-like esterase
MQEVAGSSPATPTTHVNTLRTWLQKLALSLLSLAIVFFALEIALRIRALRANRDTLDALAEPPPALPGDHNVELRYLIRIAENPRIVYEFVPGTRAMFKGAPITINRDGFRGPEIPRDKPAGTVRIAGLGDSVMFGWGVRDEECYLSLLADRLRSRYPARQWEVINSAVPGYNTAMEVEVLRAKLLAFSPDVVMVHFVGNDLSLPNFIREKLNVFSLKRSFLFDYLFFGQHVFHRNREFGLVPGNENLLVASFADSPEKVPPEYRDMVGLAAFQNALRELKELGGQHRFDVIVLADEVPDYLREACRDIGLPLVEVHDRFRAAAGSGEHITLSDKDPHPSARGHELIAEALLEYVSSNLAARILRGP